MLNQAPKVSSGTCQQFVEYAVKIINILGFSTFTRCFVFQMTSTMTMSIFVYFAKNI